MTVAIVTNWEKEWSGVDPLDDTCGAGNGQSVSIYMYKCIMGKTNLTPFDF